MSNVPFSVIFADEFERKLYRLSKKYRSIRQDVDPIIEQLQQKILLGDRLSGFGDNLYVYKIRAKNSNIQKGKSGGYRNLEGLETGFLYFLLGWQKLTQKPGFLSLGHRNRKGLETGFLKLTFATNPRNRVSLDHLCHQQTNVIETRFLAPVSCPGFLPRFLAPVSWKAEVN